jgi:hypothetical protein
MVLSDVVGLFGQNYAGEKRMPTDLILIVGNVIGISVFFGGIAVLVWLDQRGKTRRRELEHLERMRALELGRPLEDAEVARYKALGAIGVAVPIASLSAALVGTAFAFGFKEPEYRYKALVVIWLICGITGLISFPAVMKRLQKQKHPEASSTSELDARPLSLPGPEQATAGHWKAEASEQFRPGDRT